LTGGNETIFLDVGGIGIDWDAILKVIPVVAAVATAIYKFRDSRPRRRATLKTDLELLRTARDQNLDCKGFEAYVQEELSHLYQRTRKTQWGTVILGIVFAISFAVWTVYLVRDGFSWWAVATGFFAFVGTTIVIGGLEDTRRLPAEGATGKPSQEPTQS
jgi:uncharacterized membrane protein (DUF2068 family)